MLIHPAAGGPPPPRARSGAAIESLAQALAAARHAEKAGKSREAVFHYTKALQAAGDDEAAFGSVIAAIVRATRIHPNDAELRHLLGRAQLFAKHVRDAALTLAKAAALAPNDAGISQGLGEALIRSGDPVGALAAFRKAVALAPADQAMRLQLAGLLAFQGERDEARALYQALVDEGCRDPLALSGLIEVSDYAGRAEEPPEYAATIARAEDASLPPALRRMLYFSAGRIDRARKRREAEFGLYLRAKAHYPEVFDLGYMHEVLGVFTETLDADFFSARKDFADSSERPVLIFGMPRSGTTLSEQILGRHPAVAAAGELSFFSSTVSQLGFAAQRNAASLKPERMAERLRSVDRREARAIAAQYNSELQWRGGGKRRVTDKMPHNFLHLWLIALLYPRASFIHCTRDPVATCFSCFTEDLGDGHGYTQDFPTLAAYYRAYEDLMAHWQAVLPVTIAENNYEALVAEPEAATRRLLDMARLDFDPATLTFHESRRLALTASYAQVRQPIHAASLEKWRAYGAQVDPLVEALRLARGGAATG